MHLDVLEELRHLLPGVREACADGRELPCAGQQADRPVQRGQDAQAEAAAQHAGQSRTRNGRKQDLRDAQRHPLQADRQVRISSNWMGNMNG